MISVSFFVNYCCIPATVLTRQIVGIRLKWRYVKQGKTNVL